MENIYSHVTDVHHGPRSWFTARLTTPSLIESASNLKRGGESGCKLQLSSFLAHLSFYPPVVGVLVEKRGQEIL